MEILRKSMNKINITADFTEYKRVFLEENSKRNLISKNDEKFLFEKHIYDSLGIKLFFEKYNIHRAKILDIGCGGGFPCVPLAIEYPEFKITGIDSIKKKIDAINEIKNQLKLDNLSTICDRVENIKEQKFDIITSRAVADLSKIAEYALPLLKRNGYFVAYKSRKTQEEIDNATQVLKQYNAEVKEILTYTLPLEEVYERNLVVIGFKNN